MECRFTKTAQIKQTLTSTSINASDIRGIIKNIQDFTCCAWSKFYTAMCTYQVEAINLKMSVSNYIIISTWFTHIYVTTNMSTISWLPSGSDTFWVSSTIPQSTITRPGLKKNLTWSIMADDKSWVCGCNLLTKQQFLKKRKKLAKERHQ